MNLILVLLVHGEIFGKAGTYFFNVCCGRLTVRDGRSVWVVRGGRPGAVRHTSVATGKCDPSLKVSRGSYFLREM